MQRKLRRKVVEEYLKLTHYLHMGKQYKYDHIIDMINYLDVSHSINNKIIESYFLSL